MRILNAMFSRGLGGIEQCFVDYCEALMMQGHKVTAMIHPDAKIRESLVSIGVNITNVRNSGGWDFFAKSYIKKMLKQTSPDIVIAHGNRAVDLLKKPVKSVGSKIVGVTHNYKNKRLVGLDGVFAITDDLRKDIIAKGQSPEAVFFVPNMIKLSSEMPNIRDFSRPVIIGAMGRFVKKKGFDVFLRSLEILKNDGVEFKAIIGGTGEEEKSLKTLTAALGLGEFVKFQGWVADKKKFFENVDIFCLPSLHEPFGIILLEAFAASLPVVTSDSEGPSEIVIDGKDALLVAKNSPEQMALAIKDLLNNPGKAKKITLEAQKTVQKYSMGSVGKIMDNALSMI